MNDYPTCKTCKFLLPVHCHPGNNEIGKGGISTPLGWVCAYFVEDGYPAIFMDRNTDTCEVYTEKDNNDK